MGSDGGPIDLHIHSVFSDGSLTPSQIIEKATRLGLRAISITDHDTLAGSLEAQTTGIPGHLAFVTGVEISAGLFEPFANAGTCHMLGYFLDPQNAPLTQALAGLQQARRERNPRILERLAGLGIKIDYQDVVRASGGGQVGRLHIARVLLARGVVQTTDEAFERFLGRGGAAFVEKKSLPAPEAIALIRQAGGVSVLAHPSSLRMEDARLAALVGRLAAMGLGGLEVYYPNHGPDMVKKYRRLATEHHLAVTGGSDFHGDYKPKIEMGRGTGDLWVPFGVYEALRRFHKDHAAGGEACLG